MAAFTETRQPNILARAVEARAAEQRASADYREAFSRYLRGEHPSRELLHPPVPEGVPESEQRAQEVGSQAAGGFWVPSEFENRFVAVIQDTSPVMRYATILRTPTGASLTFPASDDTTEASIIAENGQITEADISAAALSIPVFTFASPVARASWQFLQDAGPAAADFLADRLGATIGRRFNRAATTGATAAEPTGILTGASVGVTAVGPATFTSDELLDLQDALDELIRFEPSAMYMLRSAVFSTARKLKGSDGHYAAWQPDPSGNSPGTLHGRRVVLNRECPTAAAGALSVTYGAFDRYVVRITSEVTVQRLDELYARTAASGFLATARLGGQLMQTASASAFVTLQQAAS